MRRMWVRLGFVGLVLVSGCVRASALDDMCCGFRPMVRFNLSLWKRGFNERRKGDSLVSWTYKE